MKRMLLAAALLTLCFLVLLVCLPVQRPVRMAWRVVQAGAPQLAPQTDVISHSFTVRPSATALSLRLEAQAGSGDLACVLIDPQGQARWTARLSGPALTERVREFDAIPGEWELKVALADYAGRHTVDWAVR